MRGVDLLWLVIGVAVATAHAFTGALTLVTANRRRGIDLLFSGLLFVAAWYSLWTALIHAGFALQWPWMMGLMPLLPGFIGPGLLIITLQITRPDRPVPRWAWATLPLGGLATAYGVILLAEPEVARAAAEALRDGHLWPDPRVLALWHMHSAQLAALGTLSVGLAVYGLLRPVSPEALELTRAWAGGIVAATCAIVVANIIPTFVDDLSTARLGPLLSLPTVAVAWHAVRRTRDLADRLERQAHKVKPFLPHALQDILRQDSSVPTTLSGKTVELTLLLSDIRQFTSLCERLPPTDVVHFLNQYLTLMSDVVARHGGTVDKYIGDAIFATFLPRDRHDDAQRAYDAAMDMRRALDEFNLWWSAQGRPPIRIGVGLHRGRVVMGSIGSPHMKQYTVVGDPVNTVARVEALTKELGVTVLLTRDVKRRLDPKVRNRLRSCGMRPVAGRREQVSLWTPEEAGALAS